MGVLRLSKNSIRASVRRRSLAPSPRGLARRAWGSEAKSLTPPVSFADIPLKEGDFFDIH